MFEGLVQPQRAVLYMMFLFPGACHLAVVAGQSSQPSSSIRDTL